MNQASLLGCVSLGAECRKVLMLVVCFVLNETKLTSNGCPVACVLRPLTAVPVGSLSRCRPASVGPSDARLRRLPYAAAYPYEKGFASVTRAYSANPQDR